MSGITLNGPAVLQKADISATGEGEGKRRILTLRLRADVPREFLGATFDANLPAAMYHETGEPKFPTIEFLRWKGAMGGHGLVMHESEAEFGAAVLDVQGVEFSKFGIEPRKDARAYVWMSAQFVAHSAVNVDVVTKLLGDTVYVNCMPLNRELDLDGDSKRAEPTQSSKDAAAAVFGDMGGSASEDRDAAQLAQVEASLKAEANAKAGRKRSARKGAK